MSTDVDLLAEARALRPLIEQEAEPTDETLTMTRPVVVSRRSGTWETTTEGQAPGFSKTNRRLRPSWNARAV